VEAGRLTGEGRDGDPCTRARGMPLGQDRVLRRQIHAEISTATSPAMILVTKHADGTISCPPQSEYGGTTATGSPLPVNYRASLTSALPPLAEGQGLTQGRIGSTCRNRTVKV
jgi:hypothetical protein